MKEAFFASFSTAMLLAVVGWIARAWITEKLAAGFRLETDKTLEEIKSRYAKQIALTDSRVAAYRSLWEKTKDLNPRDKLRLDQGQLNSIFEDLRKWYYDDGNAMHLSASTTNDFLKGLQYLECEPTEKNLTVVKKLFSSVRTHIKEDLGVYDRDEVSATLPDYAQPLADGTVITKPRDDG
ncbi:hypothetical protein [Neptunomonas qingdaonensis]|uniref:Uncharacterized protein n=1 Tax=Neptunomonas qingdaonensis TaxID=1045558 RepID=A0A1I2P8J5_9GAMM|nr:hypothetical protein [Neptunomonas qingdaonensis]SFG11399.1 hypothetical protein SAMN05216175_103281 [Neptunomonas qingdaonensis]